MVAFVFVNIKKIPPFILAGFDLTYHLIPNGDVRGWLLLF
jgi:hypothetical protein